MQSSSLYSQPCPLSSISLFCIISFDGYTKGAVACSFDGVNEEDDDDALDEKPDFLPMFPWYSGTSADMYRTMFDMLISLKLFLGRYDMRQMQVALFAWFWLLRI